MFQYKKHRMRLIQDGKNISGPVVYWMSRDQRVRDNWALLCAQEMAVNIKSPLVVVFCLVPQFLNAAIRQYEFMLHGLKEVESDLIKKNIVFFLVRGEPDKEVPAFAKKIGASAIITDFSPLRIKQKWNAGVKQKLTIPFYEVDAHNIVPCWTASAKQEYAAYTFRPKIHRMLTEYLEEIPSLKKHPFSMPMNRKDINWDMNLKFIKVNKMVKEIKWLRPGERAARQTLRKFVADKLESYDRSRNDPSFDGQSNLSPYLHFGHISAQRVALEVQGIKASKQSKDAFLEELIVRRELSDNFCHYNESYDRIEGFPEWAIKTLYKHRKDRREYIYTLEEFEDAATHDDLWNAAQLEMKVTGKMHGYMRMYWAKKILEWTESAETAQKLAIYLNDKYEIDGRDPNGYVGVAWSIGGVHDRAWGERPVFGKIRYMSYTGCRSKFNIKSYVGRWIHTDA